MANTLDPKDTEVGKVQSALTLPLCDELKVRFSQVAKDMEQAKVQGYIESNVLVQLLDLVKQVLSMAPFVA